MAPIAATRMFEASVPSMTATGKPCLISDSTKIADRFCWSYLTGLFGNTETHFTPQIFSSNRVAGRQLIRSCDVWLKICTTFSGNRM